MKSQPSVAKSVRATTQEQFVVKLAGNDILVRDIVSALSQAPNGWALSDVSWWGKGNGNLHLTFISIENEVVR